MERKFKVIKENDELYLRDNWGQINLKVKSYKEGALIAWDMDNLGVKNFNKEHYENGKELIATSTEQQIKLGEWLKERTAEEQKKKDREDLISKVIDSKSLRLGVKDYLQNMEISEIKELIKLINKREKQRQLYVNRAFGNYVKIAEQERDENEEDEGAENE